MTSQSQHQDPEPHSFAGLMNHEVVVMFLGTEYKGVLVGADDTSLYLRRSTSLVMLDLDKVTSLRPAEGGPALLQNRFIDPSFYSTEE